MVTRGSLTSTEIFCEVAGEGATVVLVHSGAFDRRLWDEQFTAFADHYRVIRYDVRGHGRSAPPTKPYSDAGDLHAVLQELHIPKAHLVGLSLGGRIAIDFALAYPEMVDRLILVAPDVSGYVFSAEANYEFVQIVMSIESDDGTPAGDRWLQSPLFVPAMANPAVAAKLLPIARENARFWLINPLLRRDLFVVPSAVQRLAEIQAPTLLVLGDRHSRDVQNMAQLVEDGIAGIRKAVIPEAGHLVNLEKPAEFNRIALAFLGSG